MSAAPNEKAADHANDRTASGNQHDTASLSGTEAAVKQLLAVARGAASDKGEIKAQQELSLKEVADLATLAQTQPFEPSFQVYEALRAAADSKDKDATAKLVAYKSTPWCVFGTFNGSRRQAGSLLSCSAIVGDADQPGTTREKLLAALDALGVAYLVYTSTSHGCGGQARYRVIIPLAKPIPREQYAAAWTWLNAQLPGMLDPGAKDATRLNYMPRVPRGALGHEVILHDSAPWLDPAAAPSVSAPLAAVAKEDPKILTEVSDAQQLTDLRSALAAIAPHAGDNEKWSEVGYALLSLGNLGFELFEAFSRAAPNYTPDAPADWWSSHSTQTPRSDFLRIFKTMAPEVGWTPPPQTSDPSAFGIVTTVAAPTLTAPPTVAAYVKLVRGTEMKPEPVLWLWRHWLARKKLHILAGAPSCGKTTIALSLASTISIGGLLPDGTRSPVGDVVIWSGEDDWADTLLPRLIAMGADISRIHHVSTVDNGDGTRRSFDPATDMSGLELAVRSIGSVALIIVDPIVSAIVGDSHKNSETRRGLQPLVDLSVKLGAALLGISHFTKSSAGQDPINRVTGSLAFGAVARVVFVAAMRQSTETGEDERVFARAKSNIGPVGDGFRYELKQVAVPGYDLLDPASTVVWGAELKGSAKDLLEEAESTGEPSKHEEALDLIKQLLERNAGLMPAADMHEALKKSGIGRDSRHKAINAAIHTHLIKLFRSEKSGPYFYRLASHTSAPSDFPVQQTVDTARVGGDTSETYADLI